MNGVDPELDELLAPLRDGPVSLTGSESQIARKARLLPSLRETVREAPRLLARQRRARRVRQAAFVAMAAALLLGFRGLFFSGPAAAPVASSLQAHVQVESQGEQPLAWIADGAAERAIAGSDQLATSGELRASDGARAALITEEGARVDVLPRSRLRMLGERGASGVETLSLLEGEVHCRVPPLRKGRSFVIATEQARVVVHGTDFRVRVGGARGSCVSVREGLVEVQHDGQSVWLGPGSDWGCEEEPVVSTKRRSRESSHARSRARERSASEITEPTESSDQPRPDVAEGTLAVETRLLADALRAEQQGERGRANALFRRFITAYPSSPLLPEAKAGLARLR